MKEKHGDEPDPESVIICESSRLPRAASYEDLLRAPDYPPLNPLNI
jgi:hypothetical protein